MKIAVRMEGGAGDHLLANRFVFAIKDKYPNAKIHLYSDTEGKTFQTELLKLLYPGAYESIEVIPNKIRKPFMVKNQFGSEDYIAHLDNVPTSYRLSWDVEHDRFYDLHIDSLKFTEYDFDWQRYFRFFPKPTSQSWNPTERYISVHLRSSSNRANDLEQWYVQNLLNRLVKIMPVHVIAAPEDVEFYGELPTGAKFITTDIKGVVKDIENSAFFLGVDSGFAYIAYCYNKPALIYNAFCREPHVVAPHQIIRWTIFPEKVIPLNMDASWVAKKVEAIIFEPGLGVLPQLSNFEVQAVKRKNEII